MSIPYRKEIDGLRAIAIIPVVLFHIGISGFSGGYVGVDIFFVISGFLITSIIINDIKNGVFSFSHFFERRIRRILPALIVVLLATLVIGYFVLLYPDDLLELGKSLVSQGLFLSNVFFLRNENYFAIEAESLPLLHTWTLSVEEQFYILFPAILFFIIVYLKKKALPIIVAIGLVSFVISLYLVNISPGDNFSLAFIPDILWNGATNQAAGFYLIISRAWELMAGAVIALWSFKIKSKKVAEIFSFIGLFAIIYSVTQFDLHTEFPGVAALLPVLGSMAIIISNTDTKTFIGRILSLKVFVFIGLISYSLYLWHWPVLVFAKMILIELSMIQKFGLIILSTCLAYITYRLVELPFKQKKYFPERMHMLSAGIVSLIIIIILGYGTMVINWNFRVPEYTRPLFEAAENMGHRYTECLKQKTVTEITEEGPCLLGNEESDISPSFVLLGDSHAGSIVSTLDNVSKTQDVMGAAFIAPGCLPISGVYRPDKTEACTQILNLALDYIQENDIKKILFVSSWNHYTGATPEVFIVDETSQESTITESQRVFEENITKMVKEFTENNIDVFIMKEIPRQHNYNQRSLFRDSVQNGELVRAVETTYEEHRKYNTYMDEVFLKLDSNVTIVDPADILCNKDGECTLYQGNTSIYSNDDHLNFIGANMLSEFFQNFLSLTAKDSR